MVGVVTTPLAGAVGDRWSHLHVSAVATGLSVVGLGTLVAGDRFAVVVLGLVVYAVGLTTFWPLIYIHLVDQLAGDTVGGDLGALRMAYFAIGSLGPTYVGFVATHHDYTVAFGSLILCFVVAGSTVVWLIAR